MATRATSRVAEFVKLAHAGDAQMALVRPPAAGRWQTVPVIKAVGVHKSACVLFPLPPDIASRVLEAGRQIPAGDLAGDGQEQQVHVTVKYGFQDAAVDAVRRTVAGVGPIRCKLDLTTVFPPSKSSDGAAVVVIEVHSPGLRRLHQQLLALDGAQPDTLPYHPHVTLAYVRPEVAEQYADGDELQGVAFTIDQVQFVTTTGQVSDLPLETPTVGKAAHPVLYRGRRLRFSHADVSRQSPEVQEATRRLEDKLTLELRKAGRAVSLALHRRLHKAYDPGESRDQHGRWTNSGAGVPMSSVDRLHDGWITHRGNFVQVDAQSHGGTAVRAGITPRAVEPKARDEAVNLGHVRVAVGNTGTSFEGRLDDPTVVGNIRNGLATVGADKTVSIEMWRKGDRVNGVYRRFDNPGDADEWLAGGAGRTGHKAQDTAHSAQRTATLQRTTHPSTTQPIGVGVGIYKYIQAGDGVGGAHLGMAHGDPGPSETRKYSEDEPRDADGRWTDGGGGTAVAGGHLTLAPDAPSTSTPVTLVFGGSFNPPHLGHVGAAENAADLLRSAGYNVDHVIIAPTADKILEHKLGERMYPLEERTELTRRTFPSSMQVSSGPGQEAEQATGKLRRTQLADWAQRQYPGHTVINVTGEDAAPGHPPAFPSLYAGDRGSNHEGYYYLAVPRPADSLSSTGIRNAIREGRTPEGMTPAAVDYLQGMFRRHPGIQKVGVHGMGIESFVRGANRLNRRQVLLEDVGRNLARYSEDQPRDDAGRWTAGGGGTAVADSGHGLAPGQATKDKYYDAATGRYSPEREALHQQVVDDMLAGKTAPTDRPPTAYILGGGTASGKTTASRSILGESPNTLRIDPDEIKLKIPEYAALKQEDPQHSAARVHEESSDLTKKVIGAAMARNLDLTYDSTTSGKSGPGMVKRLEDKGYNTHLMFVDVPVDEAKRRALWREANSPDPINQGRHVAESVIEESHQRAAGNFFALKDDPGLKSVALYDTTSNTPSLVYSRAQGAGETVYDPAKYESYRRKSRGE